MRQIVAVNPPSEHGLYLQLFITNGAQADLYVTAVRTALGEKAFAAAWAEGRAMSLEDAIQYALDGADHLDGRPVPA